MVEWSHALVAGNLAFFEQSGVWHYLVEELPGDDDFAGMAQRCSAAHLLGRLLP